MISYYELLGMIKEDKAPKEIMVHLTSKPKMYKAVYDFGDFNYYTLYEEEIIDDDYKDYLAECFLESSMFEKNIEILDKKKIPEKLGECAFVDGEIAYSWSKSEAVLKTKINEVIDYLYKLKDDSK